MEVQGGLGAAGGAGGEGDQGDVVGGGGDGGEAGRFGGAAGGEVLGAAAAVGEDAQTRGAGPAQLVQEAVVAEGEDGLRDGVQLGELGSAQQRHGGDDHPAGLQHAEPTGREPGGVGAAQQDPVAGGEAEVLGEQAGDPVGVVAQSAVRPLFGGGEQAAAVRPEPGDGVVEQGGGAVQSVGVGQLRYVEEEFWPLLEGREVVSAERVHVRRGGELHGRAPRRASGE